MVKVYTPNKGESVRQILSTKEDREKYRKEFREQKQAEQELKGQRFAEIEKRRKKGPSSGGKESINVKVGSNLK